MIFTLRPGFIDFTSDTPGECATMIGPEGQPLGFRGDLCQFNDVTRSYTWVFEYDGTPREGSKFIFAVRGRSVVGEVVRTVKICTVSEAKGDAPPTVIAEAAAKAREVVEARSVSSLHIVSNARLSKVSVVTCSHNRPDLIRTAVASLRNQTDQDWEHLIYDDASSDPRVAESLAWAQEDSRVRVWRREVNVDRPAQLWNFMLDRAHGRYLTVLDDDNEKLPRFVEVMAGELDADPSLDLVTCGWIVKDDNHSVRDSEYHLNLSTCVSELDRLSTCDGGAMLYRRGVFERVGYFSESLRTNEDWDWLRRGIRQIKFKNLYECLSTYRSHQANRMRRANDLGNESDVAGVKARPYQPTITVQSIRPAPARLTKSQEDVCASISAALATIPWVVPGESDADCTVVVSPFQMGVADLETAVEGSLKVLSLHMEDPYALSANMDRVRVMKRAARELWVCTNDAACVPYYRELVGDRVITWPSLGADPAAAIVQVTERNIDVLLCGYAYPSRKRFVRALLPRLRGLKVTLVGDGWEQYDAETLPTQNLVSTYALHTRAKAVVCLHRVHGDCSDGPVEPRTVNRGFMEGFSGARVFLDRTRSAHALDPGDVIWYDTPDDLAQSLRAYLDGTRDLAADRFADKCRSLYTYRTRLARILNCMRSPRFLAEIP